MIVLAGEAIVGNSDFAAARYTSSGALDGTFGTGGKVTPASSRTTMALMPPCRPMGSTLWRVEP